MPPTSSSAVLPRLSLLMFLQYGVWSCWFVTMGKYLDQQLHFKGPEIGLAYSTTGWGAMLAPFIVGMIADRFWPAQRLLGVLHFATAALLWSLTSITQPGAFFFVLLLAMICYMPTLALANSIGFDHVRNADRDFPLIRTFSPVGWIAAGLMVGSLPSLRPDWFGGLSNIESTAIPFKLSAGFSALLGLYAFTLPHTPPKSYGRKVTFADIVGLKTLSLMKDRSFAVFVICSLLLCIPLSFYFQTAANFFDAQGMQTVATKMTLAQVSDIVFLALMPLTLSRLGIKGTILVAVAAWLVRFLLFAFVAGHTAEWPLFAGILLHGMCYDFFFLAGQIYVDQRAPREVRANAQGFIALVTLGAGMTIGNLLNGFVTAAVTHNGVVDYRTLWLVPAGLVVVVGLLFTCFFWERGPASATSDSAIDPELLRHDAAGSPDVPMPV